MRCFYLPAFAGVAALAGILSGFVISTPVAAQTPTTQTGTAVVAARGFSFQDEAGKYFDVRLDGRAVARYMYAHDTSTPARTHETYKPFWHIFAADGQTFLTKGAGGLFTHHRGLFIGWPKVTDKSTSDGGTVDLWHMNKVAQVHQKFLQQSATPDAARVTALIHWNDAKGEPLIFEERTLTFHRTAPPALARIDWQSKLTPARGDLVLDGDPEHGGFHYRPNDDAGKDVKPDTPTAEKEKAKRVTATYLFPTAEADPKKDKDLSWSAMSYSLYGKPFHVLHMNHPTNPKSTLYSAYRDYGRFGAFFKQEVKKDQPLVVRYGILVGEGALPARETLQTRYEDYAKADDVPAPHQNGSDEQKNSKQ